MSPDKRPESLIHPSDQHSPPGQQMATAGLGGLAISFEDHDDGLAACDEALRPLLIQAGLPE